MLVAKILLHLPQSGHAWTIHGERPQSELRQLGYVEENIPTEMPRPGQQSPVPLRVVPRPDFTLHAISVEDGQEWLPADVHDLCARYVNLPPTRRDQFQRVARIFQVAHCLYRGHKTASFAMRVVACEALKPPGGRYNNLEIYDVVEGLLGAAFADALRRLRFEPQQVRGRHLHRGELLGAEGIQRMMMSTYWDPTFDQEYGVVAQISDAAIIEWLRSGGAFRAQKRKRKAR